MSKEKMPDTCACCMHDLSDHEPTTDGRVPCVYWYPVGDSPCQCTNFEEKMPRPELTCDSGVPLPENGTLADDHWCYCVGHCGYVVRYAPDRWREYGQRQMDRHIRTAHPAQWAEIEYSRQMSED